MTIARTVALLAAAGTISGCATAEHRTVAGLCIVATGLTIFALGSDQPDNYHESGDILEIRSPPLRALGLTVAGAGAFIGVISIVEMAWIRGRDEEPPVEEPPVVIPPGDISNEELDAMMSTEQRACIKACTRQGGDELSCVTRCLELVETSTSGG